jgi:nickel-type superoxide dismutase maturation protease
MQAAVRLRFAALGGALLGALAAFAVSGRWFAPLGRYVVDGPSMEPAYRAGDRVLVNRLAYRRRGPRIGDVVVLRDPERPDRFLLKRVAPHPDGIAASGAVYVLGDNETQSRDSRDFGWVPRDAIVGKAWLRY